MLSTCFSTSPISAYFTLGDVSFIILSITISYHIEPIVKDVLAPLLQYQKLHAIQLHPPS